MIDIHAMLHYKGDYLSLAFREALGVNMGQHSCGNAFDTLQSPRPDELELFRTLTMDTVLINVYDRGTSHHFLTYCVTDIQSL